MHTKPQHKTPQNSTQPCSDTNLWDRFGAGYLRNTEYTSTTQYICLRGSNPNNIIDGKIKERDNEIYPGSDQNVLRPAWRVVPLTNNNPRLQRLQAPTTFSFLSRIFLSLVVLGYFPSFFFSPLTSLFVSLGIPKQQHFLLYIHNTKIKKWDP